MYLSWRTTAGEVTNLAQAYMAGSWRERKRGNILHLYSVFSCTVSSGVEGILENWKLDSTMNHQCQMNKWKVEIWRLWWSWTKDIEVRQYRIRANLYNYIHLRCYNSWCASWCNGVSFRSPSHKDTGTSSLREFFFFSKCSLTMCEWPDI